MLTSSSPETLLLCAATAANLTAGRSSAHCPALLSALLGHPAATSSVHIQEQLVMPPPPRVVRRQVCSCLSCR